jgi:hypothetical protein
VKALLARVLEDTSLVARVRELDPRTLGRLIRHVGLEDAGEIVALASTEQLRDVFDEDLWTAEEPGREEPFDAPRFALWLEILLESGEDFVATKLTELSENLVTLGLQRQVFVIDIDALGVEMSGRHRDVDLVEKALESCLYEEIDEYRVIARRHEHWDAILTVLLALDRNHRPYFRRLIERCCRASTEYIEDNGGLYEVLTDEEVIEGDAAAEREERRASAGYVAPTDAASFLGLVRVTSLQEVMSSEHRDPVTRAYFRSLDTSSKRRGAAARAQGSPDAARFEGVLRRAGVIEAERPALPERATTGVSLPFRKAMESLRDGDADLYGSRMEELAYLTNVLVSGSSFAGRAFRPVEAAEAAIAVCNLGLERTMLETKGKAPDVVRETGADRLFRIGWHVLFWEVSMRAATYLERKVDGNQAPLAAVRAAVAAHKPWQIRPRLASMGHLLSEDERRLFEYVLDRFPTLPRARGGYCFLATMSDLKRAKRMLGS